MAKSLTEQWRDGTLEYGYYYVKNTFGWKPFGITIDFWHGPFDKWGAIPNDYVQEVLAPVPSYDEYKELVRKSDKLDKIMSDAVTNQGDCQQIVEDNLNRELENKNILLNSYKKENKRLNAVLKHIEKLAGEYVYELVDVKRKSERLEKRLAIATKALKEINKNYRFTVAQDVVYKAIKEIEEVK